MHGANFSVGVNAFYSIVRAASQALANAEDYDAWAWEAHHKMKVDAPSGTMLRLLDVMKESGYKRPIDVATNRVGWIPGTHEISFDSEAIQSSCATRRAAGSDSPAGALRAARWIAGRKGFYEFSQIWEQTL